MKRLKKLKKDKHIKIWKLVAFITGLFVLLSFVSMMMFAFLLAYESVTPKVGVVPIHGGIFSDTSESYLGFEPGARDMADKIREADADPSVSAIMLDINSGGGSIVASKELASAVREAEKPVVAYIGEIGASGAYMVAASADYVVSDEDSLTGSIGVISLFPNYLGLMNITGLDMTIMTSGDMKAAGDPYSEFTEAEQKLYMDLILEAFGHFKRDLLSDRPGITGLDVLSDGRVVSGSQALNYGLVDELGSRSLALKRAAQMGGIEGEPEEKEFNVYGAPLANIFTSMGYSLANGFKSSLTEGNGGLRA